MKPRARSYTLTPALVAAHGGGPVVCLDARALGRSYRLHARRPGASLNSVLRRGATADLVEPGAPRDPSVIEPVPSVIQVEIRGPLEQRAGYHDVCAGWTDGYDAIYERLAAALEAGDVLLVVDSPGGAVAGLAEGVRRIKAKKGHTSRRITAFVDECAGSAAYWIAAAVSDEIFLPALGMVGSIGARSAWWGCAGALAQDGIDVEHFAYPAGKVALASEKPLSETGRARAERDVMIAFEAFAAAVSEARGLSRDEIVVLDADCLSGEAAVQAKLADGVATLEDVQTYALQQASREKTMPDEDEKKKGQAEGEEPEAEDEPIETPEEAEDEEEPEAEEDEEPPPSSQRPGMKGKAAARSSRRAGSASYASIAGLREGASDLAIKTALLGHADVAAHVARLTGVSAADPQGLIGAIDALATDAAETGRYKARLAKVASREAARERMDLLGKLEAAGIHTPGELYEHDDNGKRVGPSKLWGPGKSGRKLANLREYARTRLENAGPAPRRDPFQPKAPTGAAVTEEDRRIAQNTGKDPEKVARARVALFGNSAQGAHGSFR